jgi:predicted anti-sigma-YlaC factor YlaD
MESCAKVIEWFPEYAEGELPPLESGRVSSHLDECGSCAKRVERHREMLKALDRLPQIIPPALFLDSVMSRVTAAPLAGRASRRHHLRLVKAMLWLSMAGVGGALGAASAWLLGRDFAARTGLLEPSVYVDRIESVGRLAFSFLLEIATRAEIPGLFLSPHNPFAWGGLLTTLLLSGLAAAAVGVGVLATARALLNHRER